MTIDLGTHPTPVRPVGVPPPPVPLPPPPPPRPATPPKATGPTGPDPVGDPPPDPGPHKPYHLVDHAYRLEVWSRDSRLVAVAEVRTAGLWWFQADRRHPPVYVGGRDSAETAMRELLVGES